MTRFALVTLALVLAVGCYQVHPSSGLDDAGAPVDAGAVEEQRLERLDAGEAGALDAGELCRVRWICYCDTKDGGACSRSNGAPCQAGDLLDPSADPCL